MRGMLISAGLLVALLPSTAFAQDAVGTDDGGTARLAHPHGGVQLLRSFYFVFPISDHHIAGVGVTPDRPVDGQLELVYEDENKDDDYFFHIQHLDADPAGIFVGALPPTLCRAMCTFPIARPAGDYLFVLRGFKFHYRGANETHMQHIGVYEQNGNLTVAFHDSGASDLFTVDVQYAYVPRARFTSLGNVEGWGVPGSDSRSIAPGTSVIRGFDIGFTSADHHLDELGVFQGGGGTVDVYFNDNNNDDPFNWGVDWGVMN